MQEKKYSRPGYSVVLFLRIGATQKSKSSMTSNIKERTQVLPPEHVELERAIRNIQGQRTVFIPEERFQTYIYKVSQIVYPAIIAASHIKQFFRTNSLSDAAIQIITHVTQQPPDSRNFLSSK